MDARRSKIYGNGSKIMTHSPEYIARVRELAEAGEPMAKIAEAMGRKYDSMINFCHRHQIDVTRPRIAYPVSPELAARKVAIADDYARGLTLKEIGTKHGISSERVRQIARKMGCKRERRPRLIVTSAHLQQRYEADHDT